MGFFQASMKISQTKIEFKQVLEVRLFNFDYFIETSKLVFSQSKKVVSWRFENKPVVTSKRPKTFHIV